MNNFEEFRETLRDALCHLKEPEYAPPKILYQVMGCSPDKDPGFLQACIIGALQQLKPEEDIPQDSRAWLHFRSVDWRFIKGLSQEKTAELMHMSVRNVQRVQLEAIHILARRLWTHTLHRQFPTSSVQPPDWQTQASQEIQSLSTSNPNAQTDVAEVIRSVVELEVAFAGGYGVEVTAGYVQEGLTTMVHRSVLRQTLITAITNVRSYIDSPAITIYATMEDGLAKITLTGVVSSKILTAEPVLTADIIRPPGVTISLHQRDDHIFLQIMLPIVGERTILVVEDNSDMVYFYRRCTAGTQYRILHVPTAQQIFDVIAVAKPDAIILDVMLPDMDGWQLLTHLREDDTARGIPVIVCSVVKEEDLALALGAVAFLAKPIHPHQLVAALDQALLQAPSRVVQVQANNATTA